MINKVIKEYTEQLHNKDSNYDAIVGKEKGVTKMKIRKNKILSGAAIFMVVMLIGTISTQIYAKIQWEIKFKEYQHREYEIGQGTMKEAIENGYNEEIQMEYITQEGISAKVDSLIITDDYLETKINFQFADDVKVDSEKFSFGYAIYDDQNNIYGISSRMHIGSKEKKDTYTKYIYEELGVHYNKKDMYSIQLNDASGLGNISAVDRNIISKITMGSTKGFPRSKKLYIRVFDLGYSMVEFDKENRKIKDAEDFSLSQAEWIFEIQVPDKFYERSTTELKLKEEIPGIEIEKITVTEVGLVVRAKIEGLSDIVLAGKDMEIEQWQKKRNETIHITDGDGKVYYENTMGTLQEKDSFRMNYEINKQMLNKRLFLNVKINGEQYSSELIEK